MTTRRIPPLTQHDLDRFYAKIDSSTGPAACWLWRGATNGVGYGTFNVGRQRGMFLATRIAWYLRHFDPMGAFVLHRCDNPACVNPAHLFLGDHTANMRDMQRKGRRHDTAGTGNGHAKLTPAQVAEIRTLRRGGTTLSAISRHFGISTGHVGQITLGRIWRHIGGAVCGAS